MLGCSAFHQITASKIRIFAIWAKFGQMALTGGRFCQGMRGDGIRERRRRTWGSRGGSRGAVSSGASSSLSSQQAVALEIGKRRRQKQRACDIWDSNPAGSGASFPGKPWVPCGNREAHGEAPGFLLPPSFSISPQALHVLLPIPALLIPLPASQPPRALQRGFPRVLPSMFCFARVFLGSGDAPG